MFAQFVKTESIEGTFIVYDTSTDKFVFAYNSVAWHAWMETDHNEIKKFLQDVYCVEEIEKFLEDEYVVTLDGVNIYWIEA